MLSRPRVFIGRVPTSVALQMKTIIVKHGGSLTEDISMASHVVDWDEEVDSLPSELTEEFVRTLEVRPTEDTGTALVHWFYHPDSYDEWIPSDHVDGSEPPDTVPQARELHVDRQWHVCCRFVMDCEIFNEWGNEIDYENVPEGEGEDDDVTDENNQERSPVKASAGRKARGRRRLDAVKAKKVPILESITVTEKMMQDVPPPLLDSNLDMVSVVEIVIGSDCVLKQEKYVSGNKAAKATPPTAELIPSESINDVDPAAMVIENEEDTVVQSTIGVKRKIEESDEIPPEGSISSTSTTKPKKEKNLSKKASYQSHLKLPAWYSSESINALEMKYLPDFFTDDCDRPKDTIEYFRIRNFIVSLYAHNPSIYLSATDCRRKLSGDVCAVLRIHSFLDAFGVINFHLKAECRPVIGQASVSRWSQELLTCCIANIPCNSSSSSTVVSSHDSKDVHVVEWSEDMDRTLCQRAVAYAGDWVKVSKSLGHLYTTGDTDNPWVPTPDECLAHFVSLGLPTPAFKGGMAEGSANLALTNIASAPKTQRMKFFASQIFDKAVHTLGKDGMRKAVCAALPSNSMKVRSISLLFWMLPMVLLQHKFMRFSIRLITLFCFLYFIILKGQRILAEAISSNNNCEEDEEHLQLSEQITFRLDSLGKKVGFKSYVMIQFIQFFDHFVGQNPSD